MIWRTGGGHTHSLPWPRRKTLDHAPDLGLMGPAPGGPFTLPPTRMKQSGPSFQAYGPFHGRSLRVGMQVPGVLESNQPTAVLAVRTEPVLDPRDPIYTHLHAVALSESCEETCLTASRMTREDRVAYRSGRTEALFLG